MGNEYIREKAFQDYQNGMKYKEIAEKYGVSLSAVKSWATRYWKNESCNQRKKKLQPQKKVATKIEEKKEVIAEEVTQVIENPDLTDKQRLFCLYYVRCFNATKSAVKAGYSQETAVEQGYQLLHKTSVREEIKRLKQNRLNRELLGEDDIFQRYMDIAFADMTDFAQVRNGNVEARDDIDGTLVTEISATPNGVKIKLADRMKALQWLSDHMDLATEEQRARIESVKAQTEVWKEKKAKENGAASVIADNMQALADILQNSRPNRNIDDYEEK